MKTVHTEYGETVEFEARYDDDNPRDQSFAKYTPQGE